MGRKHASQPGPAVAIPLYALHSRNTEHLKSEKRQTQPGHPPRGNMRQRLPHQSSDQTHQTHLCSHSGPKHNAGHVLRRTAPTWPSTHGNRHKYSRQIVSLRIGTGTERTPPQPRRQSQPSRRRSHGNAPTWHPPQYNQKDGTMVKRHVPHVHP